MAYQYCRILVLASFGYVQSTWSASICPYGQTYVELQEQYIMFRSGPVHSYDLSLSLTLNLY